MTAFNPKITHQIVKQINTLYERNPWQYLDDISRWDRGPDEDEQWMTDKLKAKWPGNYTVQPVLCEDGWYNYYIVFDTPADETWFRLQYA